MAESQGNPPPLNGGQAIGTPGEADQKKYVSEEEFEARVQRAVSGRLADFEKKFGKTIDGKFSEFGSTIGQTLEEKLSGLKPKADPAPPQSGQSANGAQPQFKLEEHPEFLNMRKAAEAQAKELERLQKRQAEEQKKAAEATARERKLKLNSTVEGILSKAVAPGRASHARAFLTHPENNRITYEDDDGDNLVFINDEGDKIPLEKGLKTWLKSEDAKHYLPPQNPGGSGGGPGYVPGAGANPNDPRTKLNEGVRRLLSGE